MLEDMKGLLVREIVTILMENHIYTAGGKIYRQGKGGPIGLAITTALAEVILVIFDRLF